MASISRLAPVLGLVAYALSVGVAGASPAGPWRPPKILAADWPHQLTLYAIPSAYGIAWDSPRSLAMSAAKNAADVKHYKYKHPIGHVFIGLRDPSFSADEAPDGERLAGMVAANRDEQSKLVLKEGFGLGILAADVLGKFDDPALLREEMAARYQTGGIGYMRFLLSPETGARLARYLREYQARGLDQHYGGANRPRYGEGGGCSPFGVSFLEVAGLLEHEYEREWKVRIRVPGRLFGGPHTGFKVPVRRILAYGRWAEEDEPHVPIVMWDPTEMQRWIHRRWSDERVDPSGRHLPEMRGRARGLVVDARDRPAPREPIWLTDEPGSAHPHFRQGGLHHTYEPLRAGSYEATTMGGLKRLIALD